MALSSGGVNFPIDAVYTWVDGSHPKHQELLLKFTGKSENYTRYSNNNEIYYSLYSIYKFAAWVRKIFIVVADYQLPNLIGLPQELLDKVTIVTHSEIMPLSALPTFNSMAIETCLHHIPDLSEHFIYFNDDVFLGNYVKATDFFTSSGGTYFLTTRFYFKYPLFLFPFTFDKRLLTTVIAYLQWLNLNEGKKSLTIIKPIHQCQPCNKKVLQSLWDEPLFEKELNKVLHSKTRRTDNIVTMYLMCLVGHSFKLFQIRMHDFQIFLNLNIMDIVVPFVKLLRFLKPKLFCINNDLKKSNSTVERVFQEELCRYFDGIKPATILPTTMKILIVAHPDDEMLWFNPFAFDLIIIVFCDRDDKKDMGLARKKAVNKLPYSKKILMLDLTEPGTWKNKERIAEYRTAEIALTNKLNEIKNTYHFSSIFTHNNVGEYGHVDHILVHKCVLETFSNICPIWAPNIFIRKKSKRKHIGPKYTEKNSLLKFLLLRNVYRRCGVWTWNLIYLPKFRQNYHLVNMNVVNHPLRMSVN